ncbi:MAG: hypothetical protein WDW38_005721 [Sanguina aurantia]
MAGSPTNTNFGWDESEHADLVKAIRAPLFAIAQTPLQVVIESLFSKMQAQARSMTDLQEQVERLTLRAVSSEELLARIRLLENSLNQLGTSQLSPFSQREIIDRVGDLETRAVENTSLAAANEAAANHARERRDSLGEMDENGVPVEGLPVWRTKVSKCIWWAANQRLGA